MHISSWVSTKRLAQMCVGPLTMKFSFYVSSKNLYSGNMYGYFFQLDPMKIENLVHEIILLDSAGFKHVTYESQGQHAIH